MGWADSAAAVLAAGQNGQGLAGLTVNLLDADGNIVDTTTTGARGQYSFNVDGTGQFQVQLVTGNAKQTVLSRAVNISPWRYIRQRA